MDISSFFMQAEEQNQKLLQHTVITEKNFIVLYVFHY